MFEEDTFRERKVRNEDRTIFSVRPITHAHRAISSRVHDTRSSVCDKSKLQDGEWCIFIIRGTNL